MNADNLSGAEKWTKKQLIAEDLLKAIKDGPIPPASRLPRETALAEQYGVARDTVRQAYAILIRAGEVESRGSSGYFVLAVNDRTWALTQGPRFADPWETHLANKSDSGRPMQALTIGVDPFNKLVVGRRLGDFLGLGDGERILCRSTVRYLDDKPVEITKTYLPYSVGGQDIFLNEELPEGGITTLLHREGYTLTGGRTRLIGRNPTPSEAESLEISDTTPVVELLRLLNFRPDLRVAIHSVYNGAGAEFVVDHVET